DVRPATRVHLVERGESSLDEIGVPASTFGVAVYRRRRRGLLATPRVDLIRRCRLARGQLEVESRAAALEAVILVERFRAMRIAGSAGLRGLPARIRAGLFRSSGFDRPGIARTACRSLVTVVVESRARGATAVHRVRA